MRHALLPVALLALPGCPTDTTTTATGETGTTASGPLAHILTSCIDPECQVMAFSAEMSEQADQFQWFIDGVEAGSDERIEREMPAEGLTTIDLTVSGGGLEDSTTRYVMRSPLEPVSTTGTIGTGTGGVPLGTSSVVAGFVDGCDGTAVVATVSGCFINTGPIIGQELRVTDATGTTSVSLLTYEKASNSVTDFAKSVGAAWRYQGADGYGLSVNASNYGGPAQPYYAVADGQEDHLTSYYDINSGEVLEIQHSHLSALNDPEARELSRLRLDCTAGVAQVVAVPAE